MLAALSHPVAPAAEAPQAELVSARRIWDRAPHNAFTDLVRFKERWYCVFREGRDPTSPDGSLRILTSPDGESWLPVALLFDPAADFRAPKLSVTPDDRLLLIAAAAYPPGSPHRHQPVAWHSADGRDWGRAAKIGTPDFWLWRLTWHRGIAYGFAYETTGRNLLQLNAGSSALSLRKHSPDIYDAGRPSESAILFRPDESAVCLLRRDAGTRTAQLGRSGPPYRGWDWQDLGVRVGGPSLLELPGGKIVAGVRLYDGRERTSLCWLDPDEPSLKEFLALPSGGDTSYPGLAWHGGMIWVSYYSSHEGKACIYLAKVRPPAARPPGKKRLSFGD